jgi:hypothetical protein
MVSLKFHSDLPSQKHLSLECFATNHDKIVFIIENSKKEGDLKLITLDLKTAKQLDKELRKQISFIKGANNGE